MFDARTHDDIIHHTIERHVTSIPTRCADHCCCQRTGTQAQERERSGSGRRTVKGESFRVPVCFVRCAYRLVRCWSRSFCLCLSVLVVVRVSPSTCQPRGEGRDTVTRGPAFQGTEGPGSAGRRERTRTRSEGGRDSQGRRQAQRWPDAQGRRRRGQRGEQGKHGGTGQRGANISHQSNKTQTNEALKPTYRSSRLVRNLPQVCTATDNTTSKRIDGRAERAVAGVELVDSDTIDHFQFPISSFQLPLSFPPPNCLLYRHMTGIASARFNTVLSYIERVWRVGVLVLVASSPMPCQCTYVQGDEQQQLVISTAITPEPSTDLFTYTLPSIHDTNTNNTYRYTTHIHNNTYYDTYMLRPNGTGTILDFDEARTSSVVVLQRDPYRAALPFTGGACHQHIHLPTYTSYFNRTTNGTHNITFSYDGQGNMTNVTFARPCVLTTFLSNVTICVPFIITCHILPISIPIGTNITIHVINNTANHTGRMHTFRHLDLDRDPVDLTSSFVPSHTVSTYPSNSTALLSPNTSSIISFHLDRERTWGSSYDVVFQYYASVTFDRVWLNGTELTNGTIEIQNNTTDIQSDTNPNPNPDASRNCTHHTTLELYWDRLITVTVLSPPVLRYATSTNTITTRTIRVRDVYRIPYAFVC